jgi:dTDP-4-dehydrorhamnose reductase
MVRQLRRVYGGGESEPQRAAEVNSIGASFLARACSIGKLKLLHVSTDFVFDGTSRHPYDPDDPTHPIGVYGLTKRDGEEAVRAALPIALIVRTSWLFGPNGPSFPRTMIRAHEAGRALRVVDDQIGCPTYTADLAKVLTDLMEKDPFPGIYHAVGPEAMSWHRFALMTLEAWTGGTVPIEAIPTEAYPTPAKRPAYSVLDTEKTLNVGVTKMQPLRRALDDFCRRLRESGKPL